MEEIFSLDKYKEILSNYYRTTEDENNSEERLNYINALYSNQYLLRIVENTATFTSYLLKSFKSVSYSFFANVTYKTMIYDYEFINNGCKLGGACDCIIKIMINNNDFLISKSLLQKIFPSSFRISFEQGSISVVDELTREKSTLYTDELNIIGPRIAYEDVYKKYAKKLKNKR